MRMVRSNLEKARRIRAAFAAGRQLGGAQAKFALRHLPEAERDDARRDILVATAGTWKAAVETHAAGLGTISVMFAVHKGDGPCFIHHTRKPSAHSLVARKRLEAETRPAFEAAHVALRRGFPHAFGGVEMHFISNDWRRGAWIGLIHEDKTIRTGHTVVSSGDLAADFTALQAVAAAWPERGDKKDSLHEILIEDENEAGLREHTTYRLHAASLDDALGRIFRYERAIDAFRGRALRGRRLIRHIKDGMLEAFDVAALVARQPDIRRADEALLNENQA